MKNKVIVGLLLVIVILSSLVICLGNMYHNTKVDRDRIENNFYNINQELDSVKDKNGELHYTVETLNFTKFELEKTKSDLVKEVKNMKLKIKNLESISHTEIKYIKKDSIIYVEKTADTIFTTQIKDDWIDNSWKTVLTDNRKNLKIYDYNLEITDSIIIPTEIEYKGWWIFKRPKGVKIHVKSLNPYSKINKIEYIRLHKKCGNKNKSN